MVEVLRPIGAIARALDSIANYEFKDLALAKGQYLYLVRIVEQPGITQTELINLLKVDRSTAARALRKLETQGFITRVLDSANEKNKRLFSTNKGKELYTTIRRENDYSNQTALTNFSSQEAQLLATLLARVEDNISADWSYVKKGNKREY
ncbi:putative HTH-type transcriptional regulator YybA [Ligilactobacillus pabuli]|uniref:HTH-type transcriptional regulator YybA n=1 Tax=Ligilactobacillus pabuli TaxID=2886039 RepID=A0ABQ5JKS1_9LACO|nr:MarR family winged helix-turn-helix transcriptional regulator [Ligilactobacillus pabuli]GKS82027.1 putative HTH-type transcriptional regulator YybA [Ligilactobacillus pabuli]